MKYSATYIISPFLVFSLFSCGGGGGSSYDYGNSYHESNSSYNTSRRESENVSYDYTPTDEESEVSDEDVESYEFQTIDPQPFLDDLNKLAFGLDVMYPILSSSEMSDENISTNEAYSSNNNSQSSDSNKQRRRERRRDRRR